MSDMPLPLLAEGEPPSGRACGGCTRCCEVVPVKEIGLKPFTRCPKLRDWTSTHGPGCSIYADRPYSCRGWSCLWLKSAQLPDEMRPDRSGVVVDEVVELISVEDNKTGKVTERIAAQMWVAKGHEDDWKKPEIGGGIEALVRHVGALIWRMPSGLAITFIDLPDGKIGVTEPQAPTIYSDDGPRLMRAGEIYHSRRRA